MCVVFGFGLTLHSLLNWEPADTAAYWNAAMRLREGQPLYVAAVDINAADVYRYAPWFAAAWLPLTFLPREFVELGWSIVLLIAAAAVAIPMVAERSNAGVAAGALLGGFLVQIASRGNVHPLLIMALAFGGERRLGPLWVAVAASLKAVPLLYTVVYVARREWGKAIATVFLTALLVVPMVFLGVTEYTADPGWSLSLYVISPTLFAFVAIVVFIGAVVVAAVRPRLAWLSASVSVIFALPRFFLYDVTFLAIGAIPAIPQWRKRQSH